MPKLLAPFRSKDSFVVAFSFQDSLGYRAIPRNVLDISDAAFMDEASEL
jgi:hypothetical protein